MITPARLRRAADKLCEVEDVLEAVNMDPVAKRLGWGVLMGFDLSWLAEQFDTLADRMEGG